MSVSVYYEAKRVAPISSAEKELVQNLVEKFSVDKVIEKYMETGKGLNWESFGFYDQPYEPGIILRGSTKLPDNTKDAVWTGIQHWCSALTEVRRAVKNATWDVRIDDHKIYWDENKQTYDPTK